MSWEPLSFKVFLDSHSGLFRLSSIDCKVFLWRIYVWPRFYLVQKYNSGKDKIRLWNETSTQHMQYFLFIVKVYINMFNSKNNGIGTTFQFALLRYLLELSRTLSLCIRFTLHVNRFWIIPTKLSTIWYKNLTLYTHCSWC